MGFGEALRTFINRYTDFQGRSRRSEYWWVVLAYFIVALVAGALIGTIGGGTNGLNPIGYLIVGVLAIAGLAVIVPGIALSVRRFHDLGQTGWLVLVFAILGAIPLVGLLASLAQIIWFAMPGNTGPNKYGPDPKGAPDVGVFS